MSSHRCEAVICTLRALCTDGCEQGCLVRDESKGISLDIAEPARQ